MNYTLREITEADYMWLWRLKRQTMRPYVEEMWGEWDEPLQEEFFRKNFSPATMRALMIEGRDAGLLDVLRQPGEIFLANLQIAPEFQNRRIGSAVVRDLLAEAGARGIPVRLQVLKTNHRARQLYERLGFALASETMSHWQLRAGPSKSKL